MATTYIVYNRKSGNDDQLEGLKSACDKYEVEAEFISIATLGSKFDDISKAGAATVVAAGGDGTVSAVADKLAGTDLKLGVIPVGTLNHFAKDLQIPLKIDEAVAVIVRGKTIKVDTAKVNDQFFINNSSIGVYPDTVRTREKHASKVGKWPAALYGLFVQLKAPKAYKFELNVDGKKSIHQSPFIFIGNNSYNITEAGINNRNELNGGKLCVYIIETESKLELLFLAAKAVIGKIESGQSFVSYSARQVTITGRHRQTAEVAWDGEVKRMVFPLNYSIQPLSLTVIVP